MNDYGGLLSSISKELNIQKGNNEKEPEWMARVIYSAIGQMSLASLFDVQEDNAPISITHFKRRVENLFRCYLSMFPDTRPIFSTTAEELSDEIYNIYVQAGCIYHSPNRITSSAFRAGANRNTQFVRGSSLNRPVFRSGLGAYLPVNDSKACDSITSVYGISSEPLSDQWRHLTQLITWSSTAFTSKVEYLRMEPPFSRGYFKDQPDKSGEISLLRTGFPGAYFYFFYRFSDGEIITSQIPTWLVENHEYRRISNCCLNAIGSLPPSRYHMDGEVVNLRVQYLFPPAEQNMLCLYSWPKSYVSPFSGFNLILSKPAFLAIKAEYEKIGFQFVEE